MTTTHHDWTALLAGIPPNWALIPLDGKKRPIDPATGRLCSDWNNQPGFDVAALAAMNGTVRAVGVLLGPASGGLLAVDFDGPGSRDKFRQITGHPAEDLPPTIAVTSGKTRRQQQFFSVEPDWGQRLRTRQFKGGGGNLRTVLEFRWSGCQSAIAGDHPETAGYRWCAGRAPAEVPLAAAPDWLLQAVVTGGPQPTTPAPPPPPPRSNSDDAERAVAMLAHLPPTQFEAYDDWLKVGMALHATDPGLLTAWVDWCRPMGNFNEAECLAKWESFGQGRGQQRTIASLHRLAQDHGYREPKRTAPAAAAAAAQPSRNSPSAGGRTHRELTMGEVRSRLADAISEGLADADRAQLVAELAKASGQTLAAVSKLADGIESEQRRLAGLSAESQRLAAEVDRRQIGQVLTPAYLVPPAIAAAIEARVRYLACEGPSAVLPFITAVAGLVKLGTKVEGSAAAGYAVPVNLFSCLVGPSGAKKSPVGRLLVEAPLKPLVEDLAAANQRADLEWAEMVQGLPKTAPRPPKPHPKRIYVSDHTGEALAEQLQAQEVAGLGLLISRDEISGLFQGLNAYRGGRGGDEQQLLELFDGSGMTSIRINGSRGYARSQCSIYGATQPEVLRELVAEGDATGLWARFLFVRLPAAAVQLPAASTPEEVAEVEEAARVLASACAAVYRLPPRTYRLAPEAARAFAEYEYNRQGAALKATIGAQSALYGKSAGKVLRVAGVLHLLQITAGPVDRPELIDLETLNRAIALVDHLDAWALMLHAEVASGGVGTIMLTVHKVAERAGGVIRWKEFQNAVSGKQRKEITRPTFVSAIQELEHAGFGEVTSGRNGAPGYRAIAPIPEA